MPDERIDNIDERLRSVEMAVVELGVMTKWIRVLVLIVAAGLGVDVTGIGGV